VNHPTAQGFSVVELTAALVIASLLLGGLYQLVLQTAAMRDDSERFNETVLEIRFALDRMARTAQASDRILLPLDPATRSVFAVTLPASVDRDGNGIADADNDGDKLVDEDPGSDVTNDAQPGIILIDDDADGLTDEGVASDDDESGLANEDGLDNTDSDGDGRVDEDYGSLLAVNDDADSGTDEDWFDPVVYELSGTIITERMPVPWDADGNSTLNGKDYVTNTVLEGVTLFEARRQAIGVGRTLLHLKISAQDATNNIHTLETSVRIGGVP
jgi:hypothetical protein